MSGIVRAIVLGVAFVGLAVPAGAEVKVTRDSMTCGTYNSLSAEDKRRTAAFAIERLNRDIFENPAQYDRAVRRLNLQCTRYLDTLVSEAVAGVDGKR